MQARIGLSTIGLGLLGLAACGPESITFNGQVGRRIALATGDASPLPRLSFIDEGCPGASAVGGCPPGGDRVCAPLLIDSLAPLTALKDSEAIQGRLSTECLEVRSAAGLAAEDPTQAAREGAVTRFRFVDVPLIRSPAGGDDDWSWLAGDANNQVEPAGVLGGNLLRALALRIRSPRRRAPTVTFFSDFPGTEANLANAGRAYLPLQFPGRLLGRDLSDRCDIDGDPCELPGFALTPGQSNGAYHATRMVLDACIAMPPCTVTYDGRDRLDPFSPGTCGQRRGIEDLQICASATNVDRGGVTASLVVATGVPGMVLFSDSVERMFGPLAMLPACATDTIGPDTRACVVGDAGVLHVAGWPSAGIDAPLPQLRVRSVGLVPGVVDTRDVTACERADARRNAAQLQCQRFVTAATAAGDVRNTAPPFSAADDSQDAADRKDESHAADPSSTSLVVLGEANLPLGAQAPDPARWIDATVVPATHPLVTNLRRDVAPEALQPDGLLGTVLLDDTELVLDYTDPDPGVRVRCLDPRSGDCFAAPECRVDGQPACCYGMPLELVADWIVIGEDDTCCGALSAGELAEVQQLGRCRDVNPP